MEKIEKESSSVVQRNCISQAIKKISFNRRPSGKKNKMNFSRLNIELLEFHPCQVPAVHPTEANETVPDSEEKPITEVLDFAMREIVKQDSLTDELICPMLRMVFNFTFNNGEQK